MDNGWWIYVRPSGSRSISKLEDEVCFRDLELPLAMQMLMCVCRLRESAGPLKTETAIREEGKGRENQCYGCEWGSFVFLGRLDSAVRVGRC